MPAIPRDRLPESSLALLREGYRYIPNRVKKYGSDIFTARLMLRKALVIHGENAAELFYQPDNFTREGSMPPTTVRLLQDHGSVQSLDGSWHRHRKAMFMRMMTPEGINHMLRIGENAWREAIDAWSGQDRIELLEESERLLCRMASEWIGIPLGERKLNRRASEFGAMVDGAGKIGPTMWRAMILRERSEMWARGVIRNVREGGINVPEDTPLSIMANHRDPDGALLSVNDAAVEMINLLRPTVAVAYYFVHMADALEWHPDSRRFAASSYETDREWFVQEVRRHYPFFPMIGGVARKNLTWGDIEISEGQWVLLDLYGTNHDHRVWEDPDAFNPERIQSWEESAWTLIPQGAGDHHTSHRCPGEQLTIALMKQAANKLTNDIEYTVPKQDLSIDMANFPARPASRFVMENIRLT